MKYRKSRRWRILFVLVALYAAFGFFALPPLVKWQLEKRLTETLARPVSIGQVRTNPFALSIAVNRVVVRVPDGSATLVRWNRFFVNFDPLASITREWVLGDVALDGLNAAIEVRPDGSLNFSDLIEKFRPPAEPGAPPRPAAKPSRPWRIQRLNLTDARVEFADQSQTVPFQTVVGPVNFTVLDFRTAGQRGAPGRFEAMSDAGEKVTWIGSLTAMPFTSTGELRIENLQLPKYAPYLAERIHGTITSGRLGLSVNYDVDLSPGSRRIMITDGTTQLDEFRLTENNGGEALVEIGSLQITRIDADVLAPRVGLESIRLDGGKLSVRRDADGSLNLLQMLPSQPAGPASKSPKPPLDLSVKEISVRDFAIAARDLSLPAPVETSLTRINGSLKNATLAPGSAMPLDLSFDWAPRGAVRVTGNVMREPLLADLDLEVAWLALTPLSPYLEQWLNARLARGVASLNGHARVELKAGVPPDVTFSGRGRLEDFSLVGSADGEEFASVAEFAVNDVKLTTTPRLVLSIAEVSVGSPQARVVVNEDGAMNFAQLVRAPAEGVAAAVPESAAVGRAGEGADVTVSRVLIAGGEVAYNDRSVKPPVRTALTQVGGTLRNFSSQRPESGSVELRGLVNGVGPVTALGRFNPLGARPFADVIVEGKAIDLTPAAPYVSRFAGYELESGKLFIDTKAKLADQQLDLKNTVTLEQFALGRATPGPDAVKLPVKLGIALLKDSDGRIVIELPVQGSLADPKFEIGAVVGEVFTGLLRKAATSPFTLLGSMFGGGGEELAQQEFLPGEATLTEESVRRLVTVQRALAARPALSVEIAAGYDPRVDADALKQRKFDELLRRELMREAGGREPTAEQRATAIRRVFAEKFPAGVNGQAGSAEVAGELRGPEPRETEPRFLPVSTAPLEPDQAPPRAEATAAGTEEEGRGVIGRAMDLATLKGARNWWSERRERKQREEAEARAAEERGAAWAREVEAREVAAREEAVRREAAEQAEAVARAAAPKTAPAVLSVAQMEGYLAETVAVTADDLAALATARAERVRQLLMAEGKVAPERLTIAAAEPGDPVLKGARSMLRLQ